jgi:alpha-tubulin suppressor-like RCC1 family protein
MSKVVIHRTALVDSSGAWFVSGQNTYSNSSYKYIGIGKTNPTAELDVSGNATVSGTLFVNKSIYSYDRWSSMDGSGISFFQSDGRVGIKITTPQAQLDVSGSIVCSDISSNAGTIRTRMAVDISNSVTMGAQTVTNANTVNKWNHYGHLNLYRPTIPISSRSSIEIPFDISFNNYVNTIKYNRDYTKIYFGGAFTEISVTNRNNPNNVIRYFISNFCEIDVTTGVATVNTDTNLAVYMVYVDSNNDVYVGGSFTSVGSPGMTANRIAKWNSVTSTWTNIGSLNALSYSITGDASGRIYVGGDFTSVTDVNLVTTTANYIMRYNPSTNNWSSLSSNLSGGASPRIRALKIDASGILYVGGNFSVLIGSVTRLQVVSYNINTATWIHMSGGCNTGTYVSDFAIDNSAGVVYAIGNFGNTFADNGTTVIANTAGIARWTKSPPAWSAIIGSTGSGGLTAAGLCAALDSSRNLYIAGDFGSVQGTIANQVAKWDGSSWSALGGGITTAGIVYCAEMDPCNNLLCGGSFSTIDNANIPAGNYGVYNTTTSTWSRRLISQYQYPTDSANLTNTGNTLIPTGRMVVGKTLTNSNDSVALDIGNRFFVSGNILSANSPYDVLSVYDLAINDSVSYTLSVINTFGYINRSRKVVLNGTSQAGVRIPFGTTSAVTETVYELPDSSETVSRLYMSWVNTFVLTETGKIYGIGYNIDGQCGIPQLNGPGSMTSPISSFTRGFTLDSNGVDISQKRFRKIILSGSDPLAIYAITTDNLIYATGFGPNSALVDGTASTSTRDRVIRAPNPVNFGGSINLPIVSEATVAGSWDGTNTLQTLCVLDVEGYVWTGGYGPNFRIGNASTANSTTMIKLTSISNIVSIYSSGEDATCALWALANNGELYVWGHNNANSLYNGTSANIQVPTKINDYACSGKAISRVWTSQAEVVYVQSTDNLVYATGNGPAMGLGNTNNTGWKQITHFNTDTKILVNLYVSGSGWNSSLISIFAITKNVYTNHYTLWGVGFNTERVLGIGNASNQTTFQRVNMPSSMVRNIKTIQCSTSSSEPYTMLMLKTGQLYISGNYLPFYNDTTTMVSTFTPILRSTITTEPN